MGGGIRGASEQYAKRKMSLNQHDRCHLVTASRSATGLSKVGKPGRIDFAPGIKAARMPHAPLCSTKRHARGLIGRATMMPSIIASGLPKSDRRSGVLSLRQRCGYSDFAGDAGLAASDRSFRRRRFFSFELYTGDALQIGDEHIQILFEALIKNICVGVGWVAAFDAFHVKDAAHDQNRKAYENLMGARPPDACPFEHGHRRRLETNRIGPTQDTGARRKNSRKQAGIGTVGGAEGPRDDAQLLFPVDVGKHGHVSRKNGVDQNIEHALLVIDVSIERFWRNPDDLRNPAHPKTGNAFTPHHCEQRLDELRVIDRRAIFVFAPTPPARRLRRQFGNSIILPHEIHGDALPGRPKMADIPTEFALGGQSTGRLIQPGAHKRKRRCILLPRP